MKTTAPKVAIVAPVASSETDFGGAEKLYAGLQKGLEDIGARVQLIPIHAPEPSVEAILSNYDTCAALDLSEYDAVISTKVPSYAVTHPNHVVYLVHTVRVFDDMFDERFPEPTTHDYLARSQIHKRDYEALSRAQCIYTIGHEVSRRLYRWRGLDSCVLHPPLGPHSFHKGSTGDYFFIPGRLHPWKRLDLIIAAIRRSSEPMRLIIAGRGEDETRLRALAGDDERITFAGRISDSELTAHYANCLAVPFVPKHEDYGYVTLEAFASGKPVVTSHDSGEPCFFVKPMETGLIVSPNPNSLQGALEWLWRNRNSAEQMGLNAQQSTASLCWKNVATQLLESALRQRRPHKNHTHEVAVIDMQPITPTVGGGRMRLHGLYHNFGDGSHVAYLGSYDWPGEPRRLQQLTPTLTETVVPLSDEHHKAAAELSSRISGKTCIDIAFPQMAHLSRDYIEAAKAHIAKADTVIFSHPWAYPLLADALRPTQTVVYDSQNVESYLRAQLLSLTSRTELELLANVIVAEVSLIRRANWTLACSHEDLLRFHRLYNVPPQNMRVYPNGVMAFARNLPSPHERSLAKAQLNLTGYSSVGIFLGSAYAPNNEAAKLIARQLAPLMPNVLFILAGGCSDSLEMPPTNVRVLGIVPDDAKELYLRASDFALNPLTSGSGTSIKMFDYLASGLPVISTKEGARGITETPAVIISESTVSALAEAISRLPAEEQELEPLRKNARRFVETNYSWENISHELGFFVAKRSNLGADINPFFSVIVPTYGRPEDLNRLLRHLDAQVERDFEIVIIDQTEAKHQAALASIRIPTHRFNSPIKGATRARNTGARLASGHIFCFIDDDCVPSETWLLNARKYFNDLRTVAVEGLISSAHENDPEWRPVTNVDFRGIGFMTANLMVRASAFHLAGGFDERFDDPHFREDTDFGWRLLSLGDIPFAEDVDVYHPPQLRSIERESISARSSFFVQDALLYKKHPERFMRLFHAEKQYDRFPLYWKYLELGASRHGVDVSALLAFKPCSTS